MTCWEEYLIDACASLAGTTMIDFFTRGLLGHYTAIIEEQVTPHRVAVYEFDFVTEFMDDWDETEIVSEFVMRLREMTGQYER